MTDSYPLFDMKEAKRMRDTYIKVLASHRDLLNTARLQGTDPSEYIKGVKLYEDLLESAERRIKAIEKEEASDQS